MRSYSDYYDQAKRFLQDELWRTDVVSLSWPRRFAYRLVRLLFVLGQELASGQLNLRAMSLVYTTLLSLVPMLAVSFSVLKAFGVHNQIEPVLLNIVEPLGEKGVEVVDRILTFVENVKVGVLGAVGLAFLIYMVISLIQKIESSLNYVWHAGAMRPLSRRFSDYLSVILVGPVLVFSALGMTASMLNTELVQTILSIEPFGSLVVVVTKVLPFLLIVLAFSFVYLLIPNTKVRFSSALVGGAVGGVLWQATGLIFAQFVTSSTRYAAIYSGFAIMVLFMIWVYLSWLILLLGAEVAYFHQHPEQIRLVDKRTALSGRFIEHMALLVMYWVAHRFVTKEAPLSLEELSHLVGMPGDRIAETLELLQRRDLVVETGSDPPEFLPQQDPSSLTVAEFFDLVRRPDADQTLLEEEIKSVPAIDALIDKVEVSVRDNLKGLSLRDLALKAPDDIKGQSPDQAW
jgi:membrane protein